MKKQLSIQIPYTNSLTKDQAEFMYNERKKNTQIINVFLCERTTSEGYIEHFVSTIFSKEGILKHYPNIKIIK